MLQDATRIKFFRNVESYEIRIPGLPQGQMEMAAVD